MTDQPYELRESQYSNPEQTSGQHTNGPRNVFVRKPGGPWHVLTLRMHAYAVRQWIEEIGVDEFLRTRCSRLEDTCPKK